MQKTEELSILLPENSNAISVKQSLKAKGKTEDAKLQTKTRPARKNTKTEESLSPKKEKNHSHGHRARLQKRFIETQHLMEEYEVLELLLTYSIPRKDTKHLAKEMLARFGSIRGCLCALKGELLDIEGVGEKVLSFFTLQREIISRYIQQELGENTSPVSLDDLAKLASAKLIHCEKEEVWLACLDRRNRLLNFQQIVKGGVGFAVFDMQVIAFQALNCGASRVVLFHNHPAGTPKASKDDTELTLRLCDALATLNIKLLEHIIVAKKVCFLVLAQKHINV